jgi:hypothetical protein
VSLKTVTWAAAIPENADAKAIAREVAGVSYLLLIH